MASDLSHDPTLYPLDLHLNTPYRVVIRYDIAAATTALWINPTSEQDPAASAAAATTPSAITRFGFSQSEGMGSLEIENLVVTASGGVRIFNYDAAWRYQQEANLDGQSWTDPAYDDSTWQEGQGILAFEFTANSEVLAMINTTLFDPRFPIAGAPAPITYYFRKRFNWAGLTSGVVLVLSHMIDEGAVFYLNGVEQARYNMKPGEVTYSTLSTGVRPGGDVSQWEEIFLTSPPLQTGNNVIAISLHQVNANSADALMGLELYARDYTPPRFDDPHQPADAQVLQSRSHTLPGPASGYPIPNYQWYFQRNNTVGFIRLADATNATYTIDSMGIGHAGKYYLEAGNGSTPAISRTAYIEFIADTPPPDLSEAVLQRDGKTIIVTFTEDMAVNTLNRLAYEVCSQSGDCAHVVGIVDENTMCFTNGVSSTRSSNVVIAVESALNPGDIWYVSIASTLVTDYNGNHPAGDVILVELTMPNYGVFQEGLNGYEGTQDTELRAAYPDEDRGQLPYVYVDAVAPSNLDTPVHALIRFDNIFGNAPGQVPWGSWINRATLQFRTSNPGDPVRIHRMLLSWTESSTWNSLEDGIQVDDIQAAATPTATFATDRGGIDVIIDVTTDVQAWANGLAINYGWAFLPTGSDGWEFPSSENTTLPRPELIIDFSVPVSEHPSKRR